MVEVITVKESLDRAKAIASKCPYEEVKGSVGYFDFRRNVMKYFPEFEYFQGLSMVYSWFFEGDDVLPPLCAEVSGKFPNDCYMSEIAHNRRAIYMEEYSRRSDAVIPEMWEFYTFGKPEPSFVREAQTRLSCQPMGVLTGCEPDQEASVAFDALEAIWDEGLSRLYGGYDRGAGRSALADYKIGVMRDIYEWAHKMGIDIMVESYLGGVPLYMIVEEPESGHLPF